MDQIKQKNFARKLIFNNNFINNWKLLFNTNVLWTLSFEFVKKNVLKFASMENGFCSCAMHRSTRERNAVLDLAYDCTCLNAFAVTYMHECQTHFTQFWLFLIFDFCERRKNSSSILANVNTKFFLQTQSWEFITHMC